MLLKYTARAGAALSVIAILTITYYSLMPTMQIVVRAASPDSSALQSGAATFYLRTFGKYRDMSTSAESTPLDMALAFGARHLTDDPDLAHKRSMRTASILLLNGFDIDAVDANGCTALQTAALVGEVSQVDFLLNNGANRDFTNPSSEYQSCRQSPQLLVQANIKKLERQLEDPSSESVSVESIERAISDYRKIEDLMTSDTIDKVD